MESEDLLKLQSTELSILEAVADLCEKHGLDYFLDSGTLIGAIRHDGFIPWDDDIDIAMPFEDYYEFLRIAQAELGEKYFIQNHETEPNFCRSYAKVNLNGTVVLPWGVENWDIHHGAWIDIFPMFYSDSDKDIRKKSRIYKFCCFLQKQNYYHNCLINNRKYTVRSFLGLILVSAVGLVPMKWRIKLHSRLLRYISSKKDGRYLCRCAIIVRKFEKSSYMGLKCYHKFEHRSFRVPNDYDKVLRTEYGDYMQLPPEDKRKNHGDGNIIVQI